jgi:hypothetical protein
MDCEKSRKISVRIGDVQAEDRSQYLWNKYLELYS